MIDYQKFPRFFTIYPAIIQLIAMLALLCIGSSAHATEREAILKENGESASHRYATNITPATQPAAKARSSASLRQPLSHNNHYWIQQSSITLNTDYDRDGHYSNFSLTLDIDTTNTTSLVYAVLYLSLGGGAWTEYAVTGNFSIHGATSYDSYFIEADLDSGYPSGYYDHFIEVYDAYSHEFLASHGPNDSHALISLPFESRFNDGRFSISSDITLSLSGTGFAGWSFLLPLGALWLTRRWRTRVSEH